MAGPTALLRLVRWPGAVTAAGNAATCFLLAHRPGSAGGALAATGVIAGGALVYSGGIVLNDVADAERDCEEHPGRPIPSGAVTRRQAAWFGAALLCAGIGCAALLANPSAGAVTAAAAAFALAYDFVGRGVRAAGAAFLGLARAANAAAGAVAALGGFAALAGRDGSPSVHLAHPVAIFAYTAFLTWVSTFESAGRPRRWLPGTFAIALLVVAALPWSAFPRGAWPESPGIPLLFLAAALIVAARDALEPVGPGLGAVVRAGVFGFLLVDSAWLFGAGRYEAGFWAILVYVGLRAALLRARS